MSSKARTDHSYPKSLGSHSTPSHVRTSSPYYRVIGFNLCLRRDHPALALPTRLRLGWEPLLIAWIEALVSLLANRSPGSRSDFRCTVYIQCSYTSQAFSLMNLDKKLQHLTHSCM